MNSRNRAVSTVKLHCAPKHLLRVTPRREDEKENTIETFLKTASFLYAFTQIIKLYIKVEIFKIRCYF